MHARFKIKRSNKLVVAKKDEVCTLSKNKFKKKQINKAKEKKTTIEIKK